MQLPSMRISSLATLFSLFCLYIPHVAAQSCDSNAVCVKTDARFSCTCNSGYEGSSIGCVNVDECQSNTTCKVGETCTDMPGSYICHCGHNTSNICGAYAMCENGGHSTTCVCNPGYAGNGFDCVDVDECQSHQPCDEYATCDNTQGSYICACLSGFSGENGFDCVDVDECLSHQPCDEYATCNNTQGSYICACLSGFSGDGINCADVDECGEGIDDCVSPFTCKNTLGGFVCLCGEAESCDANAECVAANNITENTTSCVCNVGYTGNGTFCNDIDECLGTKDCDVNAICTNNRGSYRCDCKTGYEGDGFNCNGAGLLVVSLRMVLCLIFVNMYKITF